MPRKSSSSQESQPEEQQSTEGVASGESQPEGQQSEQPQSAEAQSEQDTGQQSQSDGDGDQEQQVEQATQQVDEAVQSETDQGYRGVEIDGTPNENYSVEGVTSGAWVPEMAEDPVAARREAAAGND